MCVCSLWYPTCNTRTPLCHLWPVWLHNIFTHYLINGTIFEKKINECKTRVLILSTILSETFPVLRRIKRGVIKDGYWSSRKVPVIFVRFYRNFYFLSRFSKKYYNTKFHENPSCLAELFHAEGRRDGQTERQTRRG